MDWFMPLPPPDYPAGPHIHWAAQDGRQRLGARPGQVRSVRVMLPCPERGGRPGRWQARWPDPPHNLDHEPGSEGPPSDGTLRDRAAAYPVARTCDDTQRAGRAGIGDTD